MSGETQSLFTLTRHEVDCIAVAYDELLSYWETVGYEGSLDDEEMPSEKIPETLVTLRKLLDRYAKFEGLVAAATRHGGLVEVDPVRFTYRQRATVAEGLLARQMWLTAQEQRGCDSTQAEEEWDDDRLLTEVYERNSVTARAAVEAKL